MYTTCVITGPPNGPVLFYSLASVIIVCNAAGWLAGCVGGRAADTARRAGTITSR